MSKGPKTYDVSSVDGRNARKDANRKRVIEAAFRLFKSGGDAALTMRRLATEAGVSDATPYNLFKSKTGVLVAMFEAFLNQLPKPSEQGADLSALQQFLQVIDHVAELWSEQTGLFCGLMAAIERTGELPAELSERPKRGIGAAMSRLQAEGWLNGTVPPQVVADRIAHANVGVFRLWQSGHFTREELISELRLNALLPILAASDARKRDRIEKQLSELTSSHPKHVKSSEP